MINGEQHLRNMYPGLKEDQYQPAGIDLTLDKVAQFKHHNGMIYGLLKNSKVLPEHIDLQSKSIMVSGMIADVFILEPHQAYLCTTKEKIKIDNNAGQFYLPRSSLLRAGIDVRTAFGDPGFYGHLSFLVINHTDEIFVLEKGVRFAQLVDMNADGVNGEYNGDYNE